MKSKRRHQNGYLLIVLLAELDVLNPRVGFMLNEFTSTEHAEVCSARCRLPTC